ncbi:hypothetical protein P872_21005 [Rhodonellum psychrophilum GCM71 = DSM 17998]|uniref:Uncharacterized protein n=1 Tax=Rhodonellum psychrophilum GCM71 = DSM 17998 TaxID=1123057 RepID=U5BK06_9BACT|nr:hypothetical protein P872_21005 [Rhodonellum psychrophilum GCM71 = DSM 17998]
MPSGKEVSSNSKPSLDASRLFSFLQGGAGLMGLPVLVNGL